MSLNNTQNNTEQKTVEKKKIKITKDTIINNLRKTIKRQNKKLNEKNKELNEKNEALDEHRKAFETVMFLIDGCNTEKKLNKLKELAKHLFSFK